VSIVDKWLNIHRENAGVATSATCATKTKTICIDNRMSVASGLRQAATFASLSQDVASLSQPGCDKNSQYTHELEANVADVANVAGSENQRAAMASTADYSVCCECGLPIRERPETWWGGKRVHRSCGEAAFEREKARRVSQCRR
jgi:hypothetical protein